MLKHQTYDSERILSMDVEALISAWDALSEEINDDKIFGGQLLVDPAQMLMARMHDIGTAHLRGETPIPARLVSNFKTASIRSH